MALLMDTLKIGQYMYKRYHNGFKIFKKIQDNMFESLSDEYYPDRESAKKRVYELNGWNNEKLRSQN